MSIKIMIINYSVCTASSHIARPPRYVVSVWLCGSRSTSTAAAGHLRHKW